MEELDTDVCGSTDQASMYVSIVRSYNDSFPNNIILANCPFSHAGKKYTQQREHEQCIDAVKINPHTPQ